MHENHDDLTSIVVLEAGATWPAWMVEYQRLAPNSVVIAQARGETTADLKARVSSRVHEATADKSARVRVGVIVVANSGGEEQLALREAVARALLQALGNGFEAELVLAGDGQESEADRHEIFALAGALCEELGGSKVNVRVRFSKVASGVMRSVAPSAPDDDALLSKGGA